MDHLREEVFLVLFCHASIWRRVISALSFCFSKSAVISFSEAEVSGLCSFSVGMYWIPMFSLIPVFVSSLVVMNGDGF